MRGTILKARTTAGDVFWHVPTSGEVVTKAAAAAAEYKLSINKTGNDNAGTLAPCPCTSCRSCRRPRTG